MDILYISPDIQSVVEIVKDRLYFAVISSERALPNSADTIFFKVDKEFVYVNYYNDFGPLNISCLYKYCHKLNEYLRKPEYKRIVHYTPDEVHKKTNAAYLIGCFSVLYVQMAPKDIFKAFMSSNSNFKPFVDASQGGSTWTINLLDCFNAVLKASTLGFFNFKDFNPNEYDKYDKLQNGDLNWLLPRKFLAFIGPTDQNIANYHPPEFYIQYFVQNDVRTVVRLNSVTYDSAVFQSVGIDHHDLFFPDGSTPPKQILIRFLNIAENSKGAIAVHCKAGLGRTGSLIGAYIIKHFRMSARETIAWLRICRPGSVIGQQQGWLERIEAWLWRQGGNFRLSHFGVCDKIPHFKYGIYSVQWKQERERTMRQQRRRDLQNSHSASDASNTNERIFERPGDRPQIKSSSLYHPRPPHMKHTRLPHNDKYLGAKFPNTQGDKLNSIKFKQAANVRPGSTLDKKSSSITEHSHGRTYHEHHPLPRKILPEHTRRMR